MKQRINAKQLNDLTDKQKDKLREWWEPTGDAGDWFYHPGDEKLCKERLGGGYLRSILGGYNQLKEDSVCPYDIRDDKALPLLSIGQMVKFLDGNYNVDVSHGSNGWFLYLYDRHKREDLKHFMENEELCDTLWEAVKGVL